MWSHFRFFFLLLPEFTRLWLLESWFCLMFRGRVHAQKGPAVEREVAVLLQIIFSIVIMKNTMFWWTCHVMVEVHLAPSTSALFLA